MHTAVCLTIDTESSMGGALEYPERQPVPAARHIFCRNESGAYGIPLLVEELRRYDMRATFFCEMLASYALGDSETRSVTDFLLAANQDVQLHLHPMFRLYRDLQNGKAHKPASASDQLFTYSEDQQLGLLQEASEIFLRCTGRFPVAFRAGNFAGNVTTLRALSRLGIPIDSSYNAAFRSHTSFSTTPLEINLVQKISNVWEFPVTVARTRLPEGNGYKPFEVSAISSAEMEVMLESAHATGMEHVVMVLHCFSTVKPKDVFYSSFRPNRIVIRRLQKLLRYLSANSSRFVVRSLGEWSRDLAALDRSHTASIANLGFWRPLIRKGIQAVNNLYWI